MTSVPPGKNEAPKARVVAEARRLGFDAVGIARADLPLEQDFARYETFIEKGMHGEMGWLADYREARRRLDTAHILEGAKSVVCVAQSYARSDEQSAEDGATTRSIARYARGRDYHNGLRKKLRKLAKFLRALGTPEAPVAARPLCDEEPVLERAWAGRAGLGFVGKNGLLIVPGGGSFLLLGEVVTTLAIESDTPMTERCGTCTRCLDACPTKAFAAPFVLDPRRCIAYLTIEHRGAVPTELRAQIGVHVFGCDDCQSVCPFNARTLAKGAPSDPRFLPDARWEAVSLTDFLSVDDEGFVRLREGSPIGRATRVGLARNAAIALGNQGDPSALSALAHARDSHDADVVREAAAWAVETIEKKLRDNSPK